MKSGASEDPFAEDEADADQDADANDDAGAGVDSDEAASAPPAVSDTSQEHTPDGSEPAATTSAGAAPLPQQGRVPRKFRSAKEGRKRVDFYLQEITRQRLREAQTEQAERFDEDIAKYDLREAAVLVGLANPDLLAAQLSAFGYGLDEE